LIRRRKWFADRTAKHITIKLRRSGEVWDDNSQVVDLVERQFGELVADHMTTADTRVAQCEPIASI
jgi:hypothetical protein